ncbi:MAG: hypothetical protein ABEJ23_00430 [Haloarculaceae archaeon]
MEPSTADAGGRDRPAPVRSGRVSDADLHDSVAARHRRIDAAA